MGAAVGKKKRIRVRFMGEVVSCSKKMTKLMESELPVSSAVRAHNRSVRRLTSPQIESGDRIWYELILEWRIRRVDPISAAPETAKVGNMGTEKKHNISVAAQILYLQSCHRGVQLRLPIAAA